MPRVMHVNTRGIGWEPYSSLTRRFHLALPHALVPIGVAPRYLGCKSSFLGLQEFVWITSDGCTSLGRLAGLIGIRFG